MKKIKDVMTKDVEYCTPLDNVYEAAVKMKNLNVGVIPVCEEGKLLGMVTDRDLVVRGIAEKHPGSTQITSVMSDEVYTVTTDMTTSEASKIMSEKQIRRLPVVEGDRLVGIVSLGDLAVEKMSDDMAGHALSEISEPDHLQQ